MSGRLKVRSMSDRQNDRYKSGRQKIEISQAGKEKDVY